MLLRSVLSVASIFIYGWINYLLNAVGTVMSGQLAGKQFDPSDAAYIQSRIGFRIFSDFGIPTIALLAVLLTIWWKYIAKAWRGPAALVLLVGALGFASTTQQAQGYYDQLDRAEVVFILPNQSAFWVPDVGDNKASQARFMSQQYLTEHKIAAKRFQIPHTKLQNSATFRDYYVPSGRLIIVDRTPQAREWVGAAHRGTSQKDESFPCQSAEGINMTFGLSIGVSVQEDNSPAFLYHFGVYQNPSEDRSQTENQFKSVYYSRSLSDVTDTVVRKKVQTLVCNAASSRNFDQVNKDLGTIITGVEAGTKTYLDSVGITLDFIGWADTVGFDPEIQRAVNEAYAAQKLTPYLGTLERMAALRTREKWDGKLPWSTSSNLGVLLDGVAGPTTGQPKR